MALDIVLTVNKKPPIGNLETFVAFEDAADYWYLYDTMITEIRNETGQMLDLYADCKFSDHHLQTLARIITKHLTLLKQKKEKSWPVHTGTQLKPVQKEIYKPLIKNELEAKLTKFLLITNLAIEKNEMLIGRGD